MSPKEIPTPQKNKHLNLFQNLKTSISPKSRLKRECYEGRIRSYRRSFVDTYYLVANKAAQVMRLEKRN